MEYVTLIWNVWPEYVAMIFDCGVFDCDMGYMAMVWFLSPCYLISSMLFTCTTASILVIYHVIVWTPNMIADDCCKCDSFLHTVEHTMLACIAYIVCGSASLYIKTLYFFLTALATVANIEICYDVKIPQFAIFGTRVIYVFYSILFCHGLRIIIQSPDFSLLHHYRIHQVRSDGSNVAVNIWWNHHLTLKHDLSSCDSTAFNPQVSFGDVSYTGFDDVMNTKEQVMWVGMSLILFDILHCQFMYLLESMS